MKNILGFFSLVSTKVEVLLAVLMLSVVLASPAFAVWTVDLAGLTTDVTAVGLAILAVVVIIFGFRVVRSMVGR